jgi:D-alanine-D-alanine ligase-like ATP-grasp enzyme
MKKDKTKELPYLTKLIKKLAPKVGAKVVIEPEWGFVAQIRYGNGITRSIRYLALDLNRIGSSDVAKDKDFAKFFLNDLGYKTAPGTTVFSDKWARALKSKKNISYGLKYAKKHGYPLIVKPNSKSQGADVSVAHNKKDLVSSLKEVFDGDRVAVIEKYMPGKDYRVVVLDNDVISAYERVALSVTGDGKNSILKLLQDKNKLFIKSGRDTRIDFKDPRMKNKLKHSGLSWKSVLPKGRKMFLLDNANLSTGGDAKDVTETMHPKFKKLAVKITQDMGLRICGVDIMVTKGDITEDPLKCAYYIIEINSAPGLDHYVTTGAKQRKIVEAMYLKILKALGKKD